MTGIQARIHLTLFWPGFRLARVWTDPKLLFAVCHFTVLKPVALWAARRDALLRVQDMQKHVLRRDGDRINLRGQLKLG